MIPHGDEKGRINFIIGQIYQELGFDSEAFRYYRNTLKNSPEYELEFYTKLNMAQVTQLAKTNDRKRIEKYFKRLLKDPKNEEYQDRIYYEMGDFELKQGNLEDAISNYKKSVQASAGNNRQKSYSYLKLSDLYYDSLKSYELAKLYYDSTVQVMPQDEEKYPAVVERQKILEEFVKHIVTIRTNDSLLNLASMSKEEQAAIVDKMIAERAALEAQNERERLKEEKRARARAANNEEVVGSTISTSSEGIWYFYNNSSVSRGRSEFVRVWGNRELEDNWRRRNKTTVINEPTQLANTNNPSTSEQNAIQGYHDIHFPHKPIVCCQSRLCFFQIDHSYTIRMRSYTPLIRLSSWQESLLYIWD
ncbi:MAG: hypothetical protein AAFN93_28310 [Bacteroidota bacterium]